MHENVLALLRWISVSSNHTIHPCKPTSPNSGTLQPHPPAPPKRCSNSVQWRSQGVLQYCPSSLQDSLIRSLTDQKPLQWVMRFYYSKWWGHPWHSPLWHFIYTHDSSSTLWLLHQTIETWTSSSHDVTLQCTCAHVRQIGLIKPWKKSLAVGVLR